MRRRGLATRTEAGYVGWYRRYVKFHKMRHPEELGQAGVEEFMDHLAVTQGVAPGTQNQAFSALLFLYREVLGQEWVNFSAKRAKQRKVLPVVLSKDEVSEILSHLPSGTPRTVVSLLYGCGLRVTEALRLRVKDLDFPNRLIWVRQGKGGKDRSLRMPEALGKTLAHEVRRARLMFDEDEADGGARVYVEASLDRKYGGKLSASWEWYWVFPTFRRGIDPGDGESKRHHLLEGAVSKWLQKAVVKAKIEKKVTAHTFRHSYATHLCLAGSDLKSVQEALGHASVKTTEIYLQLVRAMKGVPESGTLVL